MKCEFPASIHSEIVEGLENAESSLKSTFRGIAIDFGAGEENSDDLMHFSRESLSNEPLKMNCNT
jgi:hypothetical protein